MSNFTASCTTPSTPDKDEVYQISSLPDGSNFILSDCNDHSLDKISSSPVMTMKKSTGREVFTFVSKSKAEKFHKLFQSVPPEEYPIDYFTCAYQGDILLQGHLYISPHWFCFYSKIRGRGRLIEISLEKVTSITKEKTAFIIPNAVGIHTSDSKYVFGSFVSRDAAYHLMKDLHKRFVDVLGDSFEDDVPCLSSRLHKTVRKMPGSLVSMTTKTSGVLKTSSCSFGPEKSDSVSSETDDCAPVETTDSENDNLVCDKPLHRSKNSRVGSLHPHSKKVPTIKVNDSWFFVPYLCKCLNYHGTYEAFCQIALKSLRFSKTHIVLAVCTTVVILLFLSAVVLTYKILLVQAKLDTLQLWTPALKTLYKDKPQSDIYVLHARDHVAVVTHLHAILRANIKVLEELNTLLKSLQATHLFGDTSKKSEATSSCEGSLCS